MADFLPAFEQMIKNEGGFVLHEVSGDRGGLTYAGIAKNFHPYWEGWEVIERNRDDPGLTQLVRDFYKTNYWDKVRGDDIKAQTAAQTLFDFAVNAGVRTASKLAQLVAGATPDGVIGPKSVAALNEVDEHLFVSNYALAKVARYAQIVTRNPTQRKFLLGWINRTLEGLA
jgi:lysozyme family protein